jgi:hypothetical protein
MPTTRHPLTPLWSLLLATPLALVTACTRDISVPSHAPEDDPSDAWRELFTEAVGPNGVDYDRIEEEHEVLWDYVAWVGEHGPISDHMRESKEDRRLVFLMNAYNALVIEAVLQNRPIDGVRDVQFGPWSAVDGASFFVGQRFDVDGESVSLYYLEQQRILHRYQEPLLHVGLNCASVGCPPLRFWVERSRGRRLQAQLERAMREWLRGPALEETETGYAVSELFFWYEDDFTFWSEAENLCQYLDVFAPPEAAEWMEEHAEDCPLEQITYDWSLNEAPAGTGAPSRPSPLSPAPKPDAAKADPIDAEPDPPDDKPAGG